MRILKQIGKYLIYTILTILIGLCVYILIVTGILKEDYATVFGFTYFQVETGSMSGTIEENDLVIIKLTDKYQVNDVITFRQGRSFITHRLISMSGEDLITRGDVNNTEDEPVKKSQVIGKVSCVISTSFMLSTLGVLLVLFIILTLINFETVFKKFIVRDTSKKREKEKNGKSIQIPLEDILKLQETTKKELTKEEIELLEVTFIELLEDFTREISDIDIDCIKEQDFLNQVLKLLKIKNKDIKKTELNEVWAKKFTYLYQISQVILLDDQDELSRCLFSPPFKEFYDYEFEDVGLTKSLQDKLYGMPPYVFIKLLIFAILYSDEDFFDAVFKIFKYKVKVDKDHLFTSLSKKNKRERKREEEEINIQVEFMRKISVQFSCEKELGLDEVKEYVSIAKEINKKE